MGRQQAVLGRILAGAGKGEEAREVFSRALALRLAYQEPAHPDVVEVQEELDRLADSPTAMSGGSPASP